MSIKAVASLPVIVDFDTQGVTAKQISNSPQEIANIKLATAGAGPALVFLYDTNNGNMADGNLKWVMDSASGSPDFQCFDSGLAFKKGVYAVLVQGANLRAILCLSVYHPDALGN